MMRKLYIGMIVTLAIAMLSGTAMAWDNKADKGIKVSVGTLILANDKLSELLGNGLGVFFDKQIMSGVKSNIGRDLGISIGCIKHSNTFKIFDISVGVDTLNIPILLTTTLTKKESKTYFGVGTGVMFTKQEVSINNNSDSASKISFCYKLSAGLTFGKEDNLFAGANYINGTNEANTGFMFNVGSRF